MFIPPGFAHVLIPLTQSTLVRSAAITFGIDVSGASLSPQALADSVWADFNTSLGQLMDSSVTMGPVRVSVGQDGADPVVGVGTLSGLGGRILTATSPQIAVLVKKTTALGGRRNRGRFYLPWIVASSTISEAGVVGASEVTALQTKATAFKTSLAATPDVLPMVLLHSSGSTVPAPVTALTVDSRVATQRRRLGR